MKPLSRHTHALRQSDIRAVTEMVNAVNGINLGQGICDLPTPEAIRTGAEAAIEAHKSIYSSYAGIAALRHAIAEKSRTFNQLPCQSADEVMVSVGSTGAFVTAIFALLEPGDEVILFEPFYGYHRNLLRLTDTVCKFVPLRGENWDVDFDEVERAITPKTKAIIVNTPSNPCGKVWSRTELETLLQLLEKHDLYAITDEIYEYMTYDAHEHVSLGALPGAYDRTITLSGFSKTYNMTGWRLGYAVGPAPILEKMGLLNDLFYICAPTPLQYGVAEAFAMREDYFTQLLADYTAKRTMMCTALEQSGFTFARPQGSYYVLANFESLAQKREGFEDDDAACRTLIEEAHVGTVAGKSFFQHPETGRYFLRFCYAKEFPILETACENLVRAFG